MATMRYALVILDGLGDRPHPDTGGVSPVEAAATPNLDALVARGTIGRVTVVGPGVAPESDAGVFALLGYDPVTDSPGRGVLEALGVGLDLAPGDVALRLNFATADGPGAILDSRVGRSLTTEQSRSLAESLTRADLLHDDGIRAEVRATVGHRGVLWLRPTDGRPLSKEVSNSDPFYEKVGGMGQARQVTDPRPLPVRPLDPSESAARTAQAIDRFLERAGPVLAGHTVNARRAMAGQMVANSLLVRNAGALPDHPIPSFEVRHGLVGTAVTEMPVERGIARCLGLVDRFVGPMGRDRDAALVERARVTLESLQSTPFVYVHLKGPDEPGHDGDARTKRDIVEALDRSFFGPFLAGADWSTTRIAVTADHATPCIVKGHADDPVPLLLAGAGVMAADPSGKFGEPLAARGALGEHRGREVVDLLLGRAAAPR
ncbi:MAG TPA: alkaline phosphatase family protein [Thermoplasmata archaeon]|nr:alkaline phosphatase family protein [Thermoplasmata archaeon]